MIKRIIALHCCRVQTRACHVMRRDYEHLRQKYGLERAFEDLTIEKYATLINGDENARAKIELILSEYEYEKYTTVRVPTNVTTQQMRLLMNARDENERKHVMRYLFKREIAAEHDVLRRKEHSQQYWSEKREEYSARNSDRSGIFDYDGRLVYGLWHNSVASKISSTCVKRLNASRMREAAQFGQKLAIDLDFDSMMQQHEISLLSKQINYSYSYNRYEADQPFDMHFTNARAGDPTMQCLPKFMQILNSPHALLSFHTESYLDVFPRDQIVYLSPHAPQPLTEHCFDDIYIVGGLVDKSVRAPVTLIKAKKENVRVRRLPLDEFLVWGKGSKYLCLNHVIAILHEWIKTKDWRHALHTCVPKRKIKSREELAREDAARVLKFKKYNKRV